MRTPQVIYYEAMAKRNRRRHYLWLFRKVWPFLAFAALTLVAYVEPIGEGWLTSGHAAKNHSADVFYSNCAAARAAGVAPMRYGEPGYREGLDGDDDGIACEPYPHKGH
jgi:hypothetical protein